jgi:hypothetical protein
MIRKGKSKLKQSRIIIGIAIGVGLIAVVGVMFWQQNMIPSEAIEESSIHSPYASQEIGGIKALSQEDIKGLLAGAGTPFGGMAKPAELNSYPGPRHVLDAAEAGEFELTAEQKTQIEGLYEEMRSEAIFLGEEIISIEKVIDEAFVSGVITEGLLQEKVLESANVTVVQSEAESSKTA